MKKEDGGPAFPYHLPHERFVYEGKHFTGMTLRDWFAGQALAAGKTVIEAYAVADTMLKLREKE